MDENRQQKKKINSYYDYLNNHPIMIDETSSMIGVKFILSCAVFLQIADLAQAQNVFDYLDTFGTVAILIFGIRYFIKELKTREEKHAKEMKDLKEDYLKRWNEQEDRHKALIQQKDTNTQNLLETQKEILMFRQGQKEG